MKISREDLAPMERIHAGINGAQVQIADAINTVRDLMDDTDNKVANHMPGELSSLLDNLKAIGHSLCEASGEADHVETVAADVHYHVFHKDPN